MITSNLKQTIFIVGSLFFTTAVGFSGFRIYRHFIADKMVHSKYEIRFIIQTGPEKQALPTVYLAELLGLSKDKSHNYFAFDEKEAMSKLLKSPVIRKAAVKKIRPDTIYVDYEVFKPVALVADNSNLAVDETGHVFPIEPFFAPKQLSKIYFGKEKIEKESFQIALAILSFLDKRKAFEESFVELIDVSQATHESFGKREVVMKLVEKGVIWYLRLTPHKFPEELNNFITLKKTTITKGKHKKVVDLRLSKTAYIEEVVD